MLQNKSTVPNHRTVDKSRIKLQTSCIQIEKLELPSKFHGQGVIIGPGSKSIDQDVVQRLHVRQLA